RVQEFLQTKGLQSIVAKHHTAYIAPDANISEGSQVLPMACVNTEAQIGAATIINTGAIVEHECVLGKGVHIAPGACLAGCVIVDDFATVYSRAVLAPRVKIGRGAIVGAGSV